MTHALNGKRVALLATDGFEQSELQEPKRLLESWGAQVSVVSPAKSDSIRGWKDKDWGESVKVDQPLAGARADDFHALVLPGGVINPDTLRTDADAVAFIKAFGDARKPVAAICHGPWLLVEAGLAKGHRVTSWPSLKTDLGNAGAEWTDAEVVVDGGVITSRKPGDIPAFADAVAKALTA